MVMTGTDNLKKAVVLAIATIKEVGELNKAENSWAKIQVVMGLSDNVMSIATTNPVALWDEYKAMTPAAAADFKTFIAAKCDLADDELETKIEATFNWLLDLSKVLEGGLALSKLFT